MLKKAKEALTREMERYVDKVMLPATFEAFKALLGHDGVTYDQWCAKVLQVMKGDQE